MSINYSRIMYIIFILLFFYACNQVSSISVQPNNVEFQQIGQTVKLEVKALKRDGLPANDAVILYKSRDPMVADIDSSGLITAKGAGATTIEIVSGDAMEFVHVVVRLPEKLLVGPPFINMTLASVKMIKVKLLDTNGQEIRNPPVTFKSSNQAGLQVTEDGKMTALIEGEYDVTVESLGKVAKIHVTVPPYLVSSDKGKKGKTVKRDVAPRDEYDDPRLKLFE